MRSGRPRKRRYDPYRPIYFKPCKATWSQRLWGSSVLEKQRSTDKTPSCLTYFYVYSYSYLSPRVYRLYQSIPRIRNLTNTTCHSLTGVFVLRVCRRGFLCWGFAVRGDCCVGVRWTPKALHGLTAGDLTARGCDSNSSSSSSRMMTFRPIQRWRW